MLRFALILFGFSHCSAASTIRQANIGLYNLSWVEKVTNPQVTISKVGVAKPVFESVVNKPFIESRIGNDTAHEKSGFFSLNLRPPIGLCDNIRILASNITANKVSFNIELFGRNCKDTGWFHWRVANHKRLEFEGDVFKRIATAPKGNGEEPLPIHQLRLNFKSHAAEKFFGFGEQYSFFNFKGKDIPIIVGEQGHARGEEPASSLIKLFVPEAVGDWWTTYAPMPYFFTSDKRSVFLESKAFAKFDLTQPDIVSIGVWADHMKGQIFAEESYLDIIETFTDYSGRHELLPDWFHKGVTVGLMGGTKLVENIHRLLIKSDTKVAAYWLQDWVGVRPTKLGLRLQWNWDLDRQRYPGWEKMVETLNGDGIEVLGYINPFLSKIDSLSKDRRDFFEFCMKNGLFIKDRNGEIYYTDSAGFEGVLIDFTDEDAEEGMVRLLDDMITKYGMKGWMADFGEALPMNIELANGKDSYLEHNNYPIRWAEINRRAINRLGVNNDVVTFHRSGYLGIQKHVNMMWAGDQMVTWDKNDGFRSSVMALINSGLSGVAINHSDVGGYISFSIPYNGGKIPLVYRTDALFRRWLSANVFSPAVRTHDGLSPEGSTQFYSTPQNFEFFAYSSKVYAALFSYRKDLITEAHEKGWPMVRAQMLHYDDPEVFKAPYQYLFGKDILVSPVYSERDFWKRVYLPKGTQWAHLWSGKKYQGGSWVDVSAPFGQIPVFFNVSNDELNAIALKIRSIPVRWEDMINNYPMCFEPDSDPDGDGWGWENKASCKVFQY